MGDNNAIPIRVSRGDALFMHRGLWPLGRRILMELENETVFVVVGAVEKGGKESLSRKNSVLLSSVFLDFLKEKGKGRMG